jgi:hypothetical protein
MKKPLLTLGCLAAAAWLFAACGGGPDKSAFKSASPEIKQVWNTATAADGANDYLVANTNYVALLSQPISADQVAAVQAALRALNERMQDALAKGDPAAQKAVEQLKNLHPGSGRPGSH